MTEDEIQKESGDPEDPFLDPYTRVPQGHERQCQAVGKIGQCRLVSVTGSDKCIAHGGFHQAKSVKEQAMRHYLAAQWRATVGDMADSDDLKSLKTEIGILRMILIKIMNSCKTDQDLMMRSGTISDLVVKVQKVVESCHRLDQAWGQLLDKTQLAVFGQTIITLVAQFIHDPEVLQQFAAALVQEIKNTGQIKQDSPEERGASPGNFHAQSTPHRIN